MAKPKLIVAVTSTNPPYLYDTPNVLSLPNGTEFRFRYQERWVDPSIRERVLTAPKALDGTRLILLFHSQETGHLIPLREAKVVRVEVLGPVTYVRFKAGAFLSPPPQHDHAERLARTTTWGRILLGLDTKANLKDRLPEHHYFKSAGAVSDLKPSKRGNADAWWAVVSLLGSVQALQRLPFFLVLGMQSEWGNRKGWSRLRQGGRYRLRVLEWSFKRERKEGEPKEPEPLSYVNCSSSPDLLVLEAASNAVVGQYDVVDFDFVATKLGKGKLTISLTRVREAEENVGDRQKEGGPAAGGGGGDPGHDPRASQSFHTAIPIRVTLSWWRTLVRFSLAALGATLYGWVGPVLAKEWSPEAQNAAQVLGLLLFVVGMGKLGEQTVSAGKDVRDLAKKPEQG